MPAWVQLILEVVLTAILIPTILDILNSRRWRSTRFRIVSTCREALEMIAAPETDEAREAKKGTEMYFHIVSRDEVPKFTFSHIRSHFLETLPLYTPALTPALAASVSEFQVCLLVTISAFERIVDYSENAGAVSGRLQDVMEPAVGEVVRKLIAAYIAVVESSDVDKNGAFGKNKEKFSDEMGQKMMQKFRVIVNKIFTHRGLDLPPYYA